ncbi:NAD-dependent epimerase/dehydratase family protein [Aquibacillus rhizosphaerae]|uniref:NAD-dependent epimerase/dehydratase family protein n=1 Tax=Aquibacillus rhizosphaerae TaxID=3051431 RepID=A0ABT7LAS0_9BACI|nr:NAD-dependent epimerase/dehydratase family protein [Aquibacillus sp. LR5S19]MDL4842955.1 NAD-dependent epimerase/dehydratase family protein [Aquibacillus sp. LR5S19]
MNNLRDIQVIFGTGPLGMTVMEELLLQYKHVIMVSKSGKANLADLPKSVELVRCDAKNQDMVAEICKRASVVYNCIGLPYKDWGEFPDIMEGLINGVGQTNATLVFADNLYAYGPTEGAMTEQTSYHPVGRKTEIRAKMANQVIDAHNKGKIKATICRAPDFYGPRVRESILGSRVIEHLMQGKPVEVIGNIELPHSTIYIKDFAKGLVLLGSKEASLGQIWHIPCDETTTLHELIEMCATELKTTASYRVANGVMLTIMGIFNPEMRELKETYYQFNRPFIVSHENFHRLFSLNVTPHYTAIRETIAWFVENQSEKHENEQEIS